MTETQNKNEGDTREHEASDLHDLLEALFGLWFIDFRDSSGSAPPDIECNAEIIAMIDLIRKRYEQRIERIYHKMTTVENHGNVVDGLKIAHHALKGI